MNTFFLKCPDDEDKYLKIFIKFLSSPPSQASGNFVKRDENINKTSHDFSHKGDKEPLFTLK